MKIAFYINVLSGGGAERVVANIANYLSETEEVHVINSYKTDGEYELKNSICHFYMDNNNYRNRLKKNFRRIRILRKYLKENKIDVLVSFMAEPNFRASIATIGLNTRLIVSIRNDPRKEYAGILGWFTAKLLMPLADGCVFQTNDAKQWFSKRLQKKSKIILNAVNPCFFSFNYKGKRKNIVTCGRLTEQKNHKLLIDAFAKIKNQVEDNLLIYGEGILREELENEIKILNLQDRVFLMGQTNDVASAIGSAKLFILSSDYEGMPNALMEAMTLGIPCISTDCPCGGPKMIIDDGVNGFLVSPNEVDELAMKIVYVLTITDLNRISFNAKVTAEQMFNISQINESWKEYIKEQVIHQKWK